VVKFTAAQIAVTGSPAPTVELSGIEGPEGLAFDAAGNLWVASGTGKVLKFAAARLAASGLGADLSITSNSPPPVIGPLPDPIGLAFDATGNLWVNYDGTLARLTPDDLAGTGDKSVTPAVQVGLDVAALPNGIAFDESGGLWLAYAQGKFARLAASQLTASGKQPPQTIISSPDVGYAGWLALYPAPAALPLYHRVP
jgi:sugar lactone lactonase YvrE